MKIRGTRLEVSEVRIRFESRRIRMGSETRRMRRGIPRFWE